MGVIVELRIPTYQFEFGQQCPVGADESAEIERVESGGDGSAAVFSLAGQSGDGEDSSADAPLLESEGYRIEPLEKLDGRNLYLFEWGSESDPFVRLLDDHGGSIRHGTGDEESWTFEVRFPGHDDFAAFRSACEESNLSIDVIHVYNPTNRNAGAWFGLTPRQRRTLELAVERGYYDIPRRCTTIELADELGISDQAVTERLRRGIVTFVTNALLHHCDD